MSSVQTYSVDRVREMLQQETVKSMCAMVADSDRRMTQFQEKIKLLDKGIFYPAEYFKALEITKRFARLNWLREEGHFFSGYASPGHFEATPGKQPGFILKNRTAPSVALDQIGGKSLSLFGCGEVCQIAQYKAVLSVLEEKFDHILASDSATPLQIGRPFSTNPILKLRNNLVKPIVSSEIKLGDLVYFENTEHYLLKHPRGTSVGYNTICIDPTIGSQRFAALGFPSRGLTFTQINQRLIEDYNQTPSDCFDLNPSNTETIRSFLGEGFHQVSACYKHDRLNGDFICDATIQSELDAKKITKLANSDPEDARLLLENFKIEVERGRK